MCLGAIYWARLGQVYFAATREDAAAAGFDDSLIYNEIPLNPTERKIEMRQIELPDRPRRSAPGPDASIAFHTEPRETVSTR